MLGCRMSIVKSLTNGEVARLFRIFSQDAKSLEVMWRLKLSFEAIQLSIDLTHCYERKLVGQWSNVGYIELFVDYHFCSENHPYRIRKNDAVSPSRSLGVVIPVMDCYEFQRFI